MKPGIVSIFPQLNHAAISSSGIRVLSLLGWKHRVFVWYDPGILLRSVWYQLNSVSLYHCNHISVSQTFPYLIITSAPNTKHGLQRYMTGVFIKTWFIFLNRLVIMSVYRVQLHVMKADKRPSDVDTCVQYPSDQYHSILLDRQTFLPVHVTVR